MKSVILELTRLQKEVLELDTPEEQVRKIVDSISAVVGTDVCTLYRTNNTGEMLLLASHGLIQTGPVSIPAGKGLVGLTAQNRTSINLAKADEHPAFFYVEGTREERFQSFCGVPLVRYGKVIGVLVVQSTAPVALSQESEAFLVTLSSQLALIIDDMGAAATANTQSNLYIQGVKGSSGIAIGYGLLCDHGDLYSVADAPNKNIAAEIAKWHALLADVRIEIKSEQDSLGNLLTDSVAGIFNTYYSLLGDQTLIAKVEAEIRTGNWLPGALRKGIQYFSDLFKAMDDPYLRARHEDIHHLGNKLYNSYQGKNSNPAEDIAQFDSVILTGDQVSVSDIASIPVDKLAGIICFEGSSMSHTAVLANALGIPAVMGTGSLKHLRNSERFIVDGNSGQIIRFPSDMLCNEFRSLLAEEQQLLDKLAAFRDLPAITPDGTELRLFTNSGLLADLSPGLKHGAQGIGLYRTEIPFLVRDSFPSEQEQANVYSQVLSAYKDKPVYMRTLDIGGDKQLPYFPIKNEENPALGWRGIRFSLDNIQLLMAQVRAMLTASALNNNLHILLPMISSTDELDAFNTLLDEALEQLSTEGLRIQKPKVGVMVEVPAAISQLPFWASKIDFLSIGSNDLSQYLLALDRNNARVASRYDHMHPAVIHELVRVVTLAKEHKIPVSLCGEMASDPLAVILLLGMGIQTLSMSATKLPKIKFLLRNLKKSKAEQVLKECLTMAKVSDIRHLLEATLADLKLNEQLK